MIRFPCPRCQKFLETTDDKVGTKIACANCRAILDVPLPALNKTILAHEVPKLVPISTASVPVGKPYIPSAVPQQQSHPDHYCPSCLQRFLARSSWLGQTVKCPKCGVKWILGSVDGLPQPQRHATPSLASQPTAPRKKQGFNLFAIVALLLGIATLPLANVLSNQTLGFILGGGGVLLGLMGLIYSLALQKGGATLPLASTGLCVSVCIATLILASQNAGSKKEHANLDGQKNKGFHGGSKKKDKRSGKKKEPEKHDAKNDNSKKPNAPNNLLASEKVLAPLVKKLQSEDSDDRVDSLKELAKLGRKAKPALRAICAAILDQPKEVREAGIEALEKIDPSLVKQILTLLTDDSEVNLNTSLNEIGDQTTASHYAIPIVIWVQNKSILASSRRFSPKNAVFSTCFKTLVRIVPNDEAAVNAMVEIASQFVKTGAPNRQNDYRSYFLLEQIVVNLGKLSQLKGKLRNVAISTLVLVLDKIKNYPNHYPITHTIHALQKYGPDADEAMPALKELKFHSRQEVREAAIDAIRSIQHVD